MSGLPLFDYPLQAGYKPTSPDTSRESAESINAGTLRAEVLEALKFFGSLTADEVACKLGLSILSIRPRLSELRKLGAVKDTGIRRKNSSGKNAVVWSALISSSPQD